MPKIKALTSWADRKEGDVWDASDDEARLLCAADAFGGQKAEYVDRVMTANDVNLEQPNKDSSEPPAKRRYLRRDMQAQN